MAVPDPLLTAVYPGKNSSGRAVVASLAGSLSPAEDPAVPPNWLLPRQQPSFRRAVAALRRYQGAILADPVGSGKTYVALAVAAAFNWGHPTACLVPAALRLQWEAAGKSLGIPVVVWSHEQVSRGRLPSGTRGLVIVDESHHFRNEQTRRYAHLAQWLVGRPALLLTATPIVNRLSDLGHQLILAVRDDALVMDGLISLRRALSSGGAGPALGQLVLENQALEQARPRRARRISVPGAAECGAAAGVLELVKELRLSRHESTAALLRGVLLRAAGSSPAALLGALQRYRRLLLHARDAFRAGHFPDRSALRRFTAELGDQLVWWELLPPTETSSDLALTDLRLLDSIIPRAAAALERDDPKLVRLREILIEAKPTLVFAVSRDTVRYIRDRLSDLRLAWCTGCRAGLGRTLVPRRVVLDWFREGAHSQPAARHLVVTDVAAEGLDLQRAARVVHYDLPWTPMRLEQREGRAVRLGSRYPEVEVVRFAPAPVLDRALRLEETLARKARLPASAGLGTGGRHLWRWRAELAERYGGYEAVVGSAQVCSRHRGLLAGFGLYSSGRDVTRLSATVGWLDDGGGWTEAPDIVADRLHEAGTQVQTQAVERMQVEMYLSRLTPVIRARLALTGGRRWLSPEPTRASRQAVVRLRQLISEAARLRHHDSLLQLERLLGFVAGGHTAGEEHLIEGLAAAPATELVSELSRLAPDHINWEGMEVRLSGLIVFGPRSPA